MLHARIADEPRDTVGQALDPALIVILGDRRRQRERLRRMARREGLRPAEWVEVMCPEAGVRPTATRQLLECRNDETGGDQARHSAVECHVARRGLVGERAERGESRERSERVLGAEWFEGVCDPLRRASLMVLYVVAHGFIEQCERPHDDRRLDSHRPPVGLAPTHGSLEYLASVEYDRLAEAARLANRRSLLARLFRSSGHAAERNQRGCRRRTGRAQVQEWQPPERALAIASHPARSTISPGCDAAIEVALALS